LLVNGILSLSLIFIDFELFVWPIVIVFFLVLNVFVYKFFHYPSILFGSLETTEEKYSGEREEEPPYHVDEQLVLRIDNYMHESTPFLKTEITIFQLAVRLNVPQHELSQLLRKHFEMNYFDFINGYRVEHVKRRLAYDECIPKMKVLAEECGFNSESAFFRIFKQHTGTTPFNYRRLHKKKELSDSEQG
jgi:AraC-like DNA-binding protein